MYSLGSEKKRIKLPDIAKVTKPSIQGLFSSIFGGFSGSSTPQRNTTPLPAPEPEPEVDLLTVNDSSVALTVYSAEVTTKLDKKFTAALHRSTKKEPPSKLRYELIYVSHFLDSKGKKFSQYTIEDGQVGIRCEYTRGCEIPVVHW